MLLPKKNYLSLLILYGYHKTVCVQRMSMKEHWCLFYCSKRLQPQRASISIKQTIRRKHTVCASFSTSPHLKTLGTFSAKIYKIKTPTKNSYSLTLALPSMLVQYTLIPQGQGGHGIIYFVSEGKGDTMDSSIKAQCTAAQMKWKPIPLGIITRHVTRCRETDKLHAEKLMSRRLWVWRRPAHSLWLFILCCAAHGTFRKVLLAAHVRRWNSLQLLQPHLQEQRRIRGWPLMCTDPPADLLAGRSATAPNHGGNIIYSENASPNLTYWYTPLRYESGCLP